MNIMTIIILLSLLEELPELPEYIRANRKAARDNVIARNKAIAKSHKWGLWYDEEERENGYLHLGCSWKPQQVHRKNQEGRYAEPHFGGHRRFQKQSRDYYPSWTDEKCRRRADDALKDYFNS